MSRSADSTEPQREVSLDSALKSLGTAVKTLQLYPSTSPLVEAAIERAHALFADLLDEAPSYSLVVNPRFLKHGDIEFGAKSALVEQLAQRLHERGVARLHLDTRLEKASLLSLAELVAEDQRRLDERGGFDVLFNARRPTGLHAEFLELERLFDDNALAPAEDIWEALLGGFREATDAEGVDWHSLANNVNRLQEFVEWVTASVDDIGRRTGYERLDVFRFMLENMGSIAASLSGEHVNFLVLAMRRIVDRIDPETLVELLAEPLEIESSEEEHAASGMTLADFLDGASGQQLAGKVGSPKRTLDLTQVIASALDPNQVEELVLHAMRTRASSSTRLYGLFSRLMDGRGNDRVPVARRVRAFLEQELAGGDEGEDFLANWPRFADVLEGEAPERFVSAGYDMTLRRLLADDRMTGIWPPPQVKKRLAELDASVVIPRKVAVLAEVLKLDNDDQEYERIAAELERTLHELVVHDHYGLACQQLRQIAATEADPAASEHKKRLAREVLDRFYAPETLKQLLHNALGRPEQPYEAITEIIQLRGRKTIPVLLDTLADAQTRRLRQRLLKLLTSLGEPVGDLIAERLDDERWYVIRNLLLLLGDIGGQEQLDKIALLAKHRDPRVRLQSLEALIKLGDPRAAEALVAAADDADENVRVTAIHGLGFYRCAAGIERLRTLLRLPNWRGQNNNVLRTAIIALCRLADQPSQKQIATLARRPWVHAQQRRPVQDAALWALAATPEREGAVPEPSVLRDVRPGSHKQWTQVR